jgi:hypothetical protein
MHRTSDDIVRAHESLGTRADLIAQRRAVFAAAVQVLSDGDVPEPDADVLDNPLVRGALTEVLSGSAEFRADCLQSVDELVAPGYSTVVGHSWVRLASSEPARAGLGGPLSRIAEELGRHGDDSWTPIVLTGADVETPDVWRTLVDGALLAVRLLPTLTIDLLPHVALFAVVRSDASDRLGSASAREYPGLILLPEPGGPLEVAEAIVHEGAHQKFFDLALSNRLLPVPSPDAPRFAPSWAAPGAPDWPVEQTLAACHAYVCLSVLADAVRSELGQRLPTHPHSLLPDAGRRAAEIGDWLLGLDGWIPAPGRRLVTVLLGGSGEEPSADDLRRDDRLALTGTDVIRHCGSQTLVARRGSPVDFYWLSNVG